MVRAKTVMVNSGEINGLPVHADHHILTEILKGELGFKGFAVSDWQDIQFLYQRHHIAKDNKEAFMIAVNAGVDMSMGRDLRRVTEPGNCKLSISDLSASFSYN